MVSTGVPRLLPFALASAALHAALLVSTPERLQFAVTPDGAARSVAVRLVPAGVDSAEPARTVAVADSIPRRQRPAPASTASDASASRAEADDAHSESEPTASAAAATHETESEAYARTQDEPKTTSEPAPSSRRDATPPQPTQSAETGQPNEQPEPDAESASVASGAAGKAQRAQLAQRARREVVVRFRNRFRYPRLARQHGWEGRVVLAFRVHADGRISDVEVVDSSGRAILDQAARQSLLHVERIPELAERLQGGPLALKVPVTYRLRSG